MKAGKVELRFERGTLVLSGFAAGCRDLPGAGLAWVWDERVSAWRTEALHYRQVRGALKREFGARLADEVPTAPAVHFLTDGLKVLRDDQREALEAWERSGRRGQIVMPTGTGKTEVALSAMAGCEVATLVVAPVRDLMYQWHRRILAGLGFDAGVLGDRIYRLKPVTVTTYDSAYIHMDRIGDRFGLVIFDEEHHLPGTCRREAATLCAAGMRMGLTATPERCDGRETDLVDLIGPVVYRQEIPQARGRTLADYDVVRVPVSLTPEEQERYERASRVVRGFIAERRREKPGYDWRQLCAESGKLPAARRAQKAYYAKKSIEDRAGEKLRVLEDIFRLHPRERTIVFAGSNAMAMDVSRRFLVPTLLNFSRKRERHAVLDGFARGTFPVIVANQVLDEGVDVPEAKVAVVIGGQASTRQAKQRLGRILRRSGASRALLYEVVSQNTGEEERSRRRRRSDAYGRTRNRRL
jgi:superfamily II DNA or RNA helicase